MIYLLFATILHAQTKNPDLSAISDFRTFVHDDKTLSQENNRLNLRFEEIEFAIQGYLNPYSRADIFIAKHGVEGEVEIEEASATFLRGLPLELNLKVGKYLVDFSKLNTQHPHTFPFVERPLLHRIYFGEDGFNDTGINASLLLPTGDVYSELSLNILKGDFARAHDHSHDSHSNDEQLEDEEQALGYSARWTNHFQLSDYTNLEVGLSGATTIYDSHENLRLTLSHLDFKYKWRPNKYKSLTFQGELLLNVRDVIVGEHVQPNPVIENVTTYGIFAFSNFQFSQRWNLGLKGEWLQAPESKDEIFHSYSTYAGFSPMEETSAIRLIVSREKHPGERVVNLLLMQVVFSLGPHKPHLF